MYLYIAPKLFHAPNFEPFLSHLNFQISKMHRVTSILAIFLTLNSRSSGSCIVPAAVRRRYKPAEILIADRVLDEREITTVNFASDYVRQYIFPVSF